MRTLLIVFAILLLLLTLLGTFGGSIKYNEPFFDVVPTKKSQYAPLMGGDITSRFENGPPTSMESMPSLNIPQIPAQISQFFDGMPSTMQTPMPAPSQEEFAKKPSQVEGMISTMAPGSITETNEQFYNNHPSSSSQPTSHSAFEEEVGEFNIEPFESSEYTSQPASY